MSASAHTAQYILISGDRKYPINSDSNGAYEKLKAEFASVVLDLLANVLGSNHRGIIEPYLDSAISRLYKLAEDFPQSPSEIRERVRDHGNLELELTLPSGLEGLLRLDIDGQDIGFDLGPDYSHQLSALENYRHLINGTTVALATVSH